MHNNPAAEKNVFPYVFMGIAALIFFGTIFILNSSLTRILPTFYLILAQLSLGVFIFLKNPKHEVHLSFFIFSLVLATWNAMTAVVTYPGRELGMIVFDKLIFMPATLMLALLLDFSLVFPRRIGLYSNRMRAALFILPALIMLAVPSNLIIRGIELKNGVVTPLFGVAYPLFALYTLLYVIASLYMLVFRYRKSYGLEKKQLLYLFIGLLLLCLGMVVTNLLLLWLGMAGLAVWGQAFSLFPLGFTAYAIVKSRLMDISVVISRTVAEVFTVLFLGTIYLGGSLLYLTYVGIKIDWLFLAWTMAYGVFVGHVYLRVRLFFQTTSDKLFLQGKYNYYKSLSDASSRVGGKLSLENILQVLYETFHEVVEISNPRVFLPENFTEAEKESGRYLVYDKKEYQPIVDGEEIKFDNPIVKELIATRKPIFEVKELAASLVVPCLLEDRLIAFFALGHKLSEDAYTDEDLRLLEVLANQAAITLDHTRSYEKIRTDLESMERQLERSQRLASIGTLTAGVTHEIRNPLTVIRAETERLTSQERDKEYLRQYSELVLKHVDRIAGIVQRMLGLAKEKTKRTTEIDLNELIISTLELFVISNITVKKDLRPIPTIKGDPEEMQEVFVNLIQNALEAMAHGGTLTISTLAEDHRIAIEISDTGKGIPEDLREKIFDPFFSTRHEGVGLGLSIVYRIVREHGGDIKVTSEIGKGSTFRLLF